MGVCAYGPSLAAASGFYASQRRDAAATLLALFPDCEHLAQHMFGVLCMMADGQSRVWALRDGLPEALREEGSSSIVTIFRI